MYAPNTEKTQIYFSDSGMLDPFGRARVSNPFTIFDAKFLFDKAPLFWDESLAGGATSTHLPNEASVSLAVPATTVSSALRQTRRRFNYQPGKGQLILLTGVLGSGASGITRRLGYFDDNNGLFFQLSGTTLSVVRRTFTSGAPVDTGVAQSSWNIDKLDGTGASGITIDTTKTNIFLIDFEWLGVGRVRFGFVIAGKIYYCHEMDNSNVLTLVYMTNPNQPLRYQLINDGTGAASSLKQICSTVISEGGADDLGQIRSISRGGTLFSAPNDFNVYPLVSIRLKSTHLSAAVVVPILLSIVITNATINGRWSLLLNPTIAGVDAAVWVGLSNSAVEYDISRTSTNILTGGTEMGTGYVANESPSVLLDNIKTALLLGSSIAGVSDQLILGYQQAQGGAASVLGSLTWRETI